MGVLCCVLKTMPVKDRVRSRQTQPKSLAICAKRVVKMSIFKMIFMMATRERWWYR
jgi:hypothetical protein